VRTTSAARFGRSLALPPLSVALWLRAIVLVVAVVLVLGCYLEVGSLSLQPSGANQ
jgi:hypothetical protein